MPGPGAPKTYNVEDITKELKQYIDSTPEPFVKEFLLNHPISKTHFYELAHENKELSNTIKRLLDKQELYLVKNAEQGNINATFAIFRLKQKDFGYTDKQEVEQKIDATITELPAEERKKRIAELLAKQNGNT